MSTKATDGRNFNKTFVPYPTQSFSEKYDIGELLGKGSYGTVWLCTVASKRKPKEERPTVPLKKSSSASVFLRSMSLGTAEKALFRRGWQKGSQGMQPQRRTKQATDRSSTTSSEKEHRPRETSSTSSAASTSTQGWRGGRSTHHGTSQKERRFIHRGPGIVASPATPARFACKVVQKKILNSEARVEELRREIAVLRVLAGNHDGVVRLHEVLESSTSVKLVMEYCAGGDLFDLLRTFGRLPEPAAKAVFRQLASAVTFCHDHGVLHRDIKPENIIFNTSPVPLYHMRKPTDKPPAVNAKLADFGLTVLLGTPEATAAGYTGSRFYTAPEMVRGWRYGLRVDVWSLGVVLVLMLTGRLPFVGEGDGDHAGIKQAILAGHICFDHPSWDGVSGPARDLVRWMLQVDPHLRPDAGELLNHRWLARGRLRREPQKSRVGGKHAARKQSQGIQGTQHRPSDGSPCGAPCPLDSRKALDVNQPASQAAAAAAAVPSIGLCPPRTGKDAPDKRLRWELYLACSSGEGEASCILDDSTDVDSPASAGTPQGLLH